MKKKIFTLGSIYSQFGGLPRWLGWVKNLPAVQEVQEMPAGSLGLKDRWEEGMTTHSSSLAWRIPGTEEPGRLQSMGLQRVLNDWGGWPHSQILRAIKKKKKKTLLLQSLFSVINLGDLFIYSFSNHLVRACSKVYFFFFNKIRFGK